MLSHGERGGGGGGGGLALYKRILRPAASQKQLIFNSSFESSTTSSRMSHLTILLICLSLMLTTLSPALSVPLSRLRRSSNIPKPTPNECHWRSQYERLEEIDLAPLSTNFSVTSDLMELANATCKLTAAYSLLNVSRDNTNLTSALKVYLSELCHEVSPHHMCACWIVPLLLCKHVYLHL